MSEELITEAPEIPVSDEPVVSDTDNQSWVKELRQQHRELRRENRALQEKLEALKPKQDPVGAKPTLADSNWDEEAFAEKLASWQDAKRKIDAEKSASEQAVRKQNEEWENTLRSYQTKKSARSADYADAEDNLTAVLTQAQQGILLVSADDATEVVAYLGNNDKELDRLGKITDPVKFAAAIAKIEAKMEREQKSPSVDEPIRGSSPTRKDDQLERLRAEAAKTGDYSKIHAFKRALRK